MVTHKKKIPQTSMQTTLHTGCTCTSYIARLIWARDQRCSMCGYNLDIPSRYGFSCQAFSPQHLSLAVQATNAGVRMELGSYYVHLYSRTILLSCIIISSVHGLPLTTMQVFTDSAVRLNGCLRQTQLLLLQLCRGHDLQPEGGDGVPSTVPPFHFSSAESHVVSLI